MGIIDSIKGLFPSQETAAKRRKEVFGTENKAFATSVIVGGAAAAIAAPAAIASGALLKGVQSAGSFIAQKFLQAPLVVQAAAVASVPVVAGAVVADPKILTSAPQTAGKLFDLGHDVVSLSKDLSVENIKGFVQTHPVATAAAGAASLYIGGKAALAGASAVSTWQTKNAVIDLTEQIKENVATPSVLKSDLITSSDPKSVLGNTQLVAPPVNSEYKTPIIPGSGARITQKRKARRKAKPSVFNQNVKVYNIDDRDLVDRKVYKYGG